MCTSSIMKTLKRPLHRLVNRLLQQRLHLVHAPVGGGIELGVVDKAAGIDVGTQAWQTPHGVAVMPPCPSGPWQLSDLARMRDTVVLPTPRVPVNR